MPDNCCDAILFMALSECVAQSDIQIDTFKCGLKELDAFAKKQLNKRDTDGKHKAFIALNKNKLVGYITLAPHQIALDKKFGITYKTIPVLMIEQVATDLEYQRRGIAVRLMSKAFKAAINMSEIVGITGVALWSHPLSVSFYERLGLKQVSQKDEGGLTLTLMFIPLATLKDAQSRSGKA